MIKRDENGTIVSVEKFSDITEELKKVEAGIDRMTEMPAEEITPEEKKDLAGKTADLQVLLKMATPEIRAEATFPELMDYVKVITKVKKLAEKLKAMKKDD